MLGEKTLVSRVMAPFDQTVGNRWGTGGAEPPVQPTTYLSVTAPAQRSWRAILASVVPCSCACKFFNETITSFHRRRVYRRPGWHTTCNRAVGLSEVCVTSPCLGENALSPEQAAKVARLLDLDESVALVLAEFACKGEAAPAIPKEPSPIASRKSSRLMAHYEGSHSGAGRQRCPNPGICFGSG